MAPSPSRGLIRAFLSVSRVSSCVSKCAQLRFQEPPLSFRVSSPWQCLLQRSFSAGGSGGDDEGGNLFGRRPLQNGAGSESRYGQDAKRSPQNSRGEDEEWRLFGEGGMFQKSDSVDSQQADEGWEEEEQMAPSVVPQQEDYDYIEGEYEGQVWGKPSGTDQAQPTVEEHIPGYSVQVEEGPLSQGAFPTAGWTAEVSEGGVSSEVAVDVRGDDEQDEEIGPSYIGIWAPDGRLLKAQPEPTEALDAYPPAEDAAFGDLIRKKGYTDDDIANLLAGFYEPTGLPHLDDYKFIDHEAELKKQRREMELAKIAEMAKRWVRKVDAQGFSHGVGRRKTSSARVWIKEGEGRIVINKKHHDMYFFSMDDRVQYLEPFVITDTLGVFDTYVLVRGGGTTGQAGAIRLGVSRALMWYEPSLRKVLKKAGMLTRDPRMVERKKPGKAKARKSFQWVKR